MQFRQGYDGEVWCVESGSLVVFQQVRAVLGLGKTFLNGMDPKRTSHPTIQYLRRL